MTETTASKEVETVTVSGQKREGVFSKAVSGAVSGISGNILNPISGVINGAGNNVNDASPYTLRVIERIGNLYPKNLQINFNEASAVGSAVVDAELQRHSVNNLGATGSAAGALLNQRDINRIYPQVVADMDKLGVPGYEHKTIIIEGKTYNLAVDASNTWENNRRGASDFVTDEKGRRVNHERLPKNVRDQINDNLGDMKEKAGNEVDDFIAKLRERGLSDAQIHQGYGAVIRNAANKIENDKTIDPAVRDATIGASIETVLTTPASIATAQPARPVTALTTPSTM